MRAKTRAALGSVAAVWLGAWCLQALSPVQAAGELQGRELMPARDLQMGLESGLETLLGRLLGGGQAPPPAGRIESVVVTEDAPARLTVSVTCSAGLEGRRLRGELIGRDRRSQRQFRTAPARLEAGVREAELSFEAAGGAADGEPADSAYLRVSVDGGGPSLSRVYVLGKSWGAGSGADAGPGASLVKVKARPEPLAAALPSTEPTPLPEFHPGRIVRDHRGEPPAVVIRPTPRGQPRAVEVEDHRRPREAQVTDHRRGATTAYAVNPEQRQVVLNRTAAVVQALPQAGRTLTLDPNLFAVSASDRAQGASRPNMEDSVELKVKADPIGLKADDVVSINPTVYRDQDPRSGFFYFVPQAYHLGWLADRGRYDMATLYLAATAPGAAGEVSMAAGLTAGIDPEEVRVAQELVRAYCGSNGCGPPTPQLRPFPIDPGRVAVSLSGALALFHIPADKVAPVGLSSALSDFQLAWVTDPVTKENVQLVLEQAGINGSVTLAPRGAEQSGQVVDVQIKLADRGSFARAPWQRNRPWQNPTPYPVRVKYLHALALDAANYPTVYSWNLGGATVAAGGRVEFDASQVPSWIDHKALRIWVGYTVVEDCAACTQQVVKAITGGVTSVAASQITFHTIDPLAAMGAYELAVRVRSKRFDPDGREAKEKSVVLKADNQDFALGPIYVGEQA